MKPIQIFPSNAKYTLALGGILIICAGFFTWYGTSGTFHSTLQSLQGHLRMPLQKGLLVEKEGKLLLWAKGERGTDSALWFDMTDSLIDPRNFNHGIGKDTIPSIDAPEFVGVDDSRLADAGITTETLVIGYASGGEARAYPVHIMDRHEIVNDTFGDTHLTVAW